MCLPTAAISHKVWRKFAEWERGDFVFLGNMARMHFDIGGMVGGGGEAEGAHFLLLFLGLVGGRY